MKIFIDSADIDAIKKAQDTGLIDGVTTNPSLIAKSGAHLIERLKEICVAVPDGDISAEVVSSDFENMRREANILKDIAQNIIIKLPLTKDGLKLCNILTKENVKTNVTLCFSAAQAALAAKAGATYISPFIGRLDDIGQDGMQLIKDIKRIYDHYNFKTQILSASIRHVNHVYHALMAGSDVATLPLSVFEALYNHPLTDKGLSAFLKDWESTGQTL